MPGSKLLSSHRQAYKEMIMQIEEGGQYMVNSEIRAKKAGKLNCRAAQSVLWSQQPLVANNSQYLFQVKDGVSNLGNSGGLLPGEVRLKDQDVFFCYAFAFYLLCYNEGFSATSPQRLSMTLMTFPSATFVPGAPDLFALTGLWTMGRLSVKVNGETLTPVWDMGQHYYIPQTQQPVTWTGAPALDQIDLGDDGFVITEPNWIINGGNDNQYIINYPNNYSVIANALTELLTGSGVYTFHAVCKWQGFLAQNVSSIMNNAAQK